MGEQDIEAYIIELEEILFDLLDGQADWFEIQQHTGLSDERCKEISDFYWKIYYKLRAYRGIML